MEQLASNIIETSAAIAQGVVVVGVVVGIVVVLVETHHHIKSNMAN